MTVLILDEFREPLKDACDKFAITGKRRAAFLANCSIESAGFTKLQENLYYTTPERILQIFPSKVKSLAQAKLLIKSPEALANVVYAGKLGNGPAASGDGWRYSGKGLFQLTGRNNYAEAGRALGQPYEDAPRMLLEPHHAALTAAWYWHKSGCNKAVDRGDFSSVVRRINGPARLHEAERLAAYNGFLTELGLA